MCSTLFWVKWKTILFNESPYKKQKVKFKNPHTMHLSYMSLFPQIQYSPVIKNDNNWGKQMLGQK